MKMNRDTKIILSELIKIRMNHYAISSNCILWRSKYFYLLIDIILDMLSKISVGSFQAIEHFKKIKAKFEVPGQIPPKNCIFFAAQLLQFYTVMCDKQFAQLTDVSQSIDFLEQHKQDFGDMSHNYLLEESLLIKIYNKISELDGKLEAEIAEYDKRFEKILKHDLSKLKYFLSKISLNLEQDIKLRPQSLFLNYLDIVLNYTKSFEIDFKIKLNLNLELEKLEGLLQEQQTYFKKIHECLDKIESNVSQTDPFFLGNDLFSRFPITTFAHFKAHILSLEHA